MDGLIYTPAELLKRHDDLAYVRVIQPEIEQKLKDLFKEFSDKLYEVMSRDDEVGEKACRDYYTKPIIGFTVRAKKVGNEEFELIFGDIYMGLKSNISPILPYTRPVSTEDFPFHWFNRAVRQCVYDSGWKTGKLHKSDYRFDELLVYFEKESIQ